MPDLTYEAQYQGPVAGIDEAGRGPLAGPVIAAAVILPDRKIPSGLNDSKALSRGAREHLLNMLQQCAQIGIGIAEPAEIDRKNILGATMAAMKRAVTDLPIAPQAVLIDGNRLPSELPCPAQAIVKGDSKSLSIAAASIVAKVTRDRLMEKAGRDFGGYDLERHMGYPTAFHRAAVARLGPSPIHRLSFKPCKLAWAQRRAVIKAQRN